MRLVPSFGLDRVYYLITYFRFYSISYKVRYILFSCDCLSYSLCGSPFLLLSLSLSIITMSQMWLHSALRYALIPLITIAPIDLRSNFTHTLSLSLSFFISFFCYRQGLNTSIHIACIFMMTFERDAFIKVCLRHILFLFFFTSSPHPFHFLSYIYSLYISPFLSLSLSLSLSLFNCVPWNNDP